MPINYYQNQKMKSNLLILSIFVLLAFSCQNKSAQELPYLGNPTFVNGKAISHTVRQFKYLNQDSISVTNDSLANVVYVADFFFTSCPSICPKVARQMLTIYNEFKNNDNVKLVSFTIDPKRDTPSKLKKYAANLEVDTKKWIFLTGDKDATLELARDYFVTAKEDASAPGGFDHSGQLILIDRFGHVRSFCEGTDPSTIPAFISNINSLINATKQ